MVMKKKKLRLLVTKVCNRKCPGCCNKDWDLSAIPKIGLIEMLDYEEIMITGGEPMLYPNLIKNLTSAIKFINPDCKVFIYTAHLEAVSNAFIKLNEDSHLKNVDGFHLTIHEDAGPVENAALYRIQQFPRIFEGKSMRLQVFPDVTQSLQIRPSFWQRITFNPWIKNCPLPIDEDFCQLSVLFENMK